jgi:hypothetical protein
MLSGFVGAVFLPVITAQAADLVVRKARPLQPVQLTAVDGINWKAEAFGGSFADRSIFGGKASLTVPMGGLYGVQVDAAVGRFDSRSFGVIGGHLFWRNPTVGLLGIYANHTYWDIFNGAHVTQVAAEAEYYAGPWTLQGIAGAEFGNNATQVTTSAAGTLVESFDVTTRFFDKINLAYYFNPNWKVFIGHRYLGGRNAFAGGTEWGLPLGSGVQASLFVEGRAGENDFHGIWGGAKFYFGRTDKPLIRRHREDDPINWSPETLFSILNSFGSSFTPTQCLLRRGAAAADLFLQADSDGECLTPL